MISRCAPISPMLDRRDHSASSARFATLSNSPRPDSLDSMPNSSMSVPAHAEDVMGVSPSATPLHTSH
eukprot:750537-Hanusia_phi.AAC.2